MQGGTTSFLWPRDGRSFLAQRNVNSRASDLAGPSPAAPCTHSHARTEATARPDTQDSRVGAPLAGPSARELLLQPEEYLCQLHNLSALEAQARLAAIAQRFSPLRASPRPGRGTQAVLSVYDRFFAHRHSSNRTKGALCLPAGHGSGCGLAVDGAVATGVAALDAALMGGLRRGFLTELTGGAGGGKTVLALNWAVHALLSSGTRATGNTRKKSNKSDAEGAMAEVLWLHSSAHAPHPQRMAMICEAQLCRRTHRSVNDRSPPSSQPTPQEAYRSSMSRSAGNAMTATQEEMNATCRVEDHFFMLPVTDLDTLLAKTCTDIEAFLQAHQEHEGNHMASNAHGTPFQRPSRVELLVIDCLTELVRRSYGGVEADTLARQTALAALTARLKRWAEEYDIAVLLLTERPSTMHGEDNYSACLPPFTSSTTSVNETDEQPQQQQQEEQAGEFGRLFYHAVNVRLQLSECYCWPGGTLRRRLSVLKSPVCPCMHLFLRGGDMGVQDAGVERGDCRAVCEDVYASVDVIDYLGVPTFVFA